MCDTSNITVGTIVMVKVGRNEIKVVTEITANGWKVKKVGSDREFIVTRIERVIAEPGASEAAPATEPEAEEEVDTPNPAPESGGSPEKKLSLLNAALQVLKRSRTPLNTKEILAQVIEEGLWSPNGAKTPERSSRKSSKKVSGARMEQRLRSRAFTPHSSARSRRRRRRASARVPPAGAHSSSTADRSSRCGSRSGKCIQKQFPRRIQRQEQLDVCAKVLRFYFLSAPKVIPNQTGTRSAGFLRKFSKGCCRNGRSRQLLGMSLQFRQTVFRLNPPGMDGRTSCVTQRLNALASGFRLRRIRE